MRVPGVYQLFTWVTAATAVLKGAAAQTATPDSHIPPSALFVNPPSILGQLGTAINVLPWRDSQMVMSSCQPMPMPSVGLPSGRSKSMSITDLMSLLAEELASAHNSPPHQLLKFLKFLG